jgi:hypothetical protein
MHILNIWKNKWNFNVLFRKISRFILVSFLGRSQIEASKFTRRVELLFPNNMAPYANLNLSLLLASLSCHLANHFNYLFWTNVWPAAAIHEHGFDIWGEGDTILINSYPVHLPNDTLSITFENTVSRPESWFLLGPKLIPMNSFDLKHFYGIK